VAIAAVRLSASTGLPSLLIYIGIGLAVGESGLGLRFDDARLSGVLGYAALVVILAEGGLTTRWSTIRPTVGPAAVLATIGTCVSIAVTGAGAHWLLGWDWRLGLLLGATVSVTDAAAVFSVLRRVPLPQRMVGLLEAESGFNDAPAVIAVVTLTGTALGGHAAPWWILVLEAIGELVIGAVVGLALGRLGVAGLRRVALPASGLYPIAVLGLAVLGYGAAASLHGSGFLATYLCCLVLGNARLPHGAAVRGFAEGAGWMAQIGLFVLLGLLASPGRLPAQVVPAIVIGLVLLLLARPLSLITSVSWFRIRWREQVFLSWAGLRGAVPIVLATIPLSEGVAGATQIFDLVFVLVVVLTAAQGPTLPAVARRLRFGADLASMDLDVETSPLGALDADVMQVTVGPGSRLHGVELFELRLPDRANVTLVIRGDDAFVPGPTTALRHGDELIVVVAASARAAAERRLREVSEGGKLAAWSRPRASGTPTVPVRRLALPATRPDRHPRPPREGPGR
jgi:cell volume regulation protein A